MLHFAAFIDAHGPLPADIRRAIAETATKDNLLFDMLPAQAKLAIYNSMTPLECEEGMDIIVQGDKDARTFYVLESGSCDVYIYKSKDPADGMKKVHQYAAAR